MAGSMHEYLEEDMACEGVLECFHGLTELDTGVFGELTAANEPLTVDEIAERVDRERTTAYRSVQRLVSAGFVRKEQVNYEQGGYYHVFRPADPDVVAENLQRMLNDWYAKMGQLISEFRDKYETPEPAESQV